MTDNWSRHVEPLVYSLSISHPQHQVVIHLVYQTLTVSTRSRLYQLDRLLHNIHIIFCEVPSNQIAAIPMGDYALPIETYFRFLLPELLPEVDRVFYLDVDTLVCGNLWDAYQTELGKSCIAAVIEKDIQIFFPDYPGTIGIQADQYFNAGVLLLDLVQMRQRDLSQILMDLAVKHHASLQFGDQDILNLYFKDEVVFLPEGYNYTNYMMRYVVTPWENLTILHFNGPTKPWFTEFECEPGYVDYYMTYIARYKDYHLDYLELLLHL